MRRAILMTGAPYPGAHAAAALLHDARRTRVRLAGLPKSVAPSTVHEGYRVQAAAIYLANQPVAGYKVGLTTAQAQAHFGSQEPIVGRLMQRDLRHSPARIAIDAGHLAVVEAEVVFEIGRALPREGARLTEQEVMASVAQAYAGIEICDSRFAASDGVSLPCMIADNAYADHLVIGTPLPHWDSATLESMPVILDVNPQVRVIGHTAAVLGNPIRSLVWLANWLADQGESLLPRQFVATGSCTGITEATRTDQVTATFGASATVSVEFEAATATGQSS